MKKFLTILFAAAMSFSAFADDPIATGEYEIVVLGQEEQQLEPPYEIFQVTCWYGTPSSSLRNETRGLKLGIPFTAGLAVYGVDLGIFGALSDEVDGVQLGFFTTLSEEVNGVQIALVNIANTIAGLQLGVVNVADDQAFQIGLLNYIEDGWLPLFPFINFNF